MNLAILTLGVTPGCAILTLWAIAFIVTLADVLRGRQPPVLWLLVVLLIPFFGLVAWWINRLALLPIKDAPAASTRRTT